MVETFKVKTPLEAATEEAPVRFNAAMFSFVARFASTEETRYYLNGVQIEPNPEGGVVMVATNGWAMGIAVDPNGKTDRVRIVASPSHSGFNAAVKHSRKLAHRTILLRDGSGRDARECLVFDKAEQTDRCFGSEIDGTFPDWRRVVPWDLMDNPSAARADFDFEKVARFAAPCALAEAYGSHAPRLIQNPADISGAALVTRQDLPWFLGILMPLRGDNFRFGQFKALAPSAEKKPRASKAA